MTKTLQKVFKDYFEKVEKNINDSFDCFGLEGEGLRPSIEYVLKSGGKRIRPMIIYMMAKALGEQCPVDHIALAIEWIHTTTLIADDLPCMDNDDYRRGKLALHKEFDEATALLASYALVAAAYDQLRLNAQLLFKIKPMEDASNAYFLAMENVSYNTGVFGVTGGQYDDLFVKEPSEEVCQEIIRKKTGALFEVTFVLGWLFGGGNPSFLQTIKEIAAHFGYIFQLVDDVMDLSRDLSNEKKKSFNYVQFFGEETARNKINEERELFKKKLKELDIDCTEFFELIDYVIKQA